jgi:hypothetical protein
MSSSRTAWPLIVAGALLGAGALGSAWYWLGPPTAPAAKPVALFYADAQAMFLVPVETPLAPAADAAAWASAVFARLQAPSGGALQPAVPPGAKLRLASFAAPRWSLTVEAPQAGGSTAERLMVGALVRTFVAGWPGAREVKIALVDAAGRPLPSQHLDLSAPLTVADVANTMDAGPVTSGVRSTLWWPSKDADALVPVQLPLEGGTGIPPRDAFERLVAGPPDEARAFLRPVLPPGVTARWASLDAGVAGLELAGELPTGEPGRRFVEAVVLTLTEFPDVRAVLFLQGGQAIDRQVGPFALGAPVPRPAGANPPATADRQP